MNPVKVKIKPLSVNEAWMGRRFKTSKYAAYRKELMLVLPSIVLPKPPYCVEYEFGVSNPKSDYDNPIKPFQDALQERYGFDDKDIFEANIKKTLVPRGSEYVKFSIWSRIEKKEAGSPGRSVVDEFFGD